MWKHSSWSIFPFFLDQKVILLIILSNSRKNLTLRVKIACSQELTRLHMPVSVLLLISPKVSLAFVALVC